MIGETLLEMHFHAPLIDLFEQTFGTMFLRIIKPSPNRECWVGFDQGWFRSDLSEKQLYDELKSTLKVNGQEVEKLYLAYFFQFKIVHELNRKSKLMSENYSTPYYRSELDLTPNNNTGISQHETLLKLINIKNCQVYYACGMLFESIELYDRPVDLDKLVFIPVKDSPTGWTTNQRHFLVFQDKLGNDMKWCSKPIDGRALPINIVVSQDQGIRLLTAEELTELIANVRVTISEGIVSAKSKASNEVANIIPDCFTILEFVRLPLQKPIEE